MVLNLGGFSFEARLLNGLSFSSDYKISSSERIKNYEIHQAPHLESLTLSISGKTLPFRFDGTKALKPLYDLATTQGALPLVGANGDYYGKFIIKTITEEQSVFVDGGGFFYQNFTLELIRDWED